MDTVNSFDVFDTLLGRKCFLPEGIFEEVESISGFPKFKEKRMEAERISQPKNIVSIYEQFKLVTGCNADTANSLMELELDRELANTFPINCNIQKVQDGDILVSDSHFSPAHIYKFLNHINFNKKVEVYSTPAGKKTGMIWSLINKKYNLKSHLGDNYQSDYAIPRQYGIESIHFDNSLTNQEKTLFNSHLGHLAKIVRYLRLLNPYSGIKGRYWELEASINFPLLIAASYVLKSLCSKNNYKRLLFATRDCVHWRNVYGKLFNEEIIEFYTSRVMLRRHNEDYKNYFRSIYDDKISLIVDINSGSNRYANFIKSVGLKTNLFVIFTHWLTELEDGQYYKRDNYKTFKINTFEILNYDLIGSLVAYENGQPVRLPIEFDTNIIKAGHECISMGIQMIDKSKMENMNEVKDKILEYEFENIKQITLDDTIKHAFKHGIEGIKLI